PPAGTRPDASSGPRFLPSLFLRVVRRLALPVAALVFFGGLAFALGAAASALAFGARAAGGSAAAVAPATRISTWLVRFLIGVPRPIAAILNPFRLGPSFTTAVSAR